jgi:putative SOS response-associated peptidase YedK
VCGRYAVSARAERLADQFDVVDIFDGLPGPDYNVAPTVSVPAVFERTVKAGDGSAGTGQVRRRLAPLTWGLVPSWAKDRSIGSRLINARVESVAEKPAFRKAFAARRCLLPADGFYEWYTPDGHDSDTPRGSRGKGGVRKQPFFLHRRDGGLLVMAGLYEIWRDPALDREDDAAWLRTCTVVTTEATDAAGHIHDRMPMVVRPDAIDAWLDPTLTDPERVLPLLATDAADLEAYAVSTEVNNVRNNGPELLEPLAVSSDGTGPEPVDGHDAPTQEPLV